MYNKLLSNLRGTLVAKIIVAKITKFVPNACQLKKNGLVLFLVMERLNQTHIMVLERLERLPIPNFSKCSFNVLVYIFQVKVSCTCNM